jgi:hypothetical protein
MIQTASLRLLADAGIKWHRIDVEWAHVERVQGQDDWSDIDRIVDEADVLGISLLAILGYTPTWAGNGKINSLPKDPRQFYAFVRRAAQRYGSRMAAWSIWNEPNLKPFWDSGFDSFVKHIFRPGLLELKVHLPSCTTVGPDLSSTKNNACLKDWFPGLLREAGHLLSVISHHQYDGQDTVQGRVAELDRVHRFLVEQGYEHLPFWCTEIGWDRPSPEKQAELLRDTMRSMQMRNWWSKTFWYDSHGTGWGLLEPDLTPNAGAPKPAFHAYKQLIAESGPPPQEGD